MADPEILEAFKIYLEKTRGLQPKTVRDYMAYYKTVDPLQEIDEVFVKAFLQLHGNNSNVRGFISNLLRFIGKDLEIRMPEKSLKDKKKKLIRPISKEEIGTLKKYFYSMGFKQGLIFDLIYQGALRRSEIPTIKINSFQWNDWFYNNLRFCKLVIKGKGDKERGVLINAETMLGILDYYNKNAGLNEENINRFFKLERLIFKKLNGKIMNEQNIYDMIKRGSKKVIGRDVRPHELRHCLLETALILTTNGWKTYKEIHKGDLIYSFNLNTEKIEVRTIKEIFIYNFDGELNHIKNNWLDYSCTEEHKLIVDIGILNTKNNKRKDIYSGYKRISLLDLQKIKSLRNIRHKISGKYDGDTSIGKEKAGILGWILTDGKIGKREYPDISIFQSLSANQKKCEYIENLLIKGNIPHTETIRKCKGFGKEVILCNFQILKGGNHHELGKGHDWIFEFLNKDRTPKWNLLNLKHEELEELYKCMMMGDGSRDIEFCNQDPKRIEFFRVLCSLLGKNTILGSKIQNGKKYYRVYIQKKDYCQLDLKQHISKERYKGKVWCISNENETFFAKENDKIFITGNCRATELLEKGASIHDIKNFLGHSSIAITEIYLHQSEKQSLKNIEKFL